MKVKDMIILFKVEKGMNIENISSLMEDIGTNRKVSPDAKLSWYGLGENDYKKLKKEIERKVNNKKI